LATTGRVKPGEEYWHVFKKLEIYFYEIQLKLQNCIIKPYM